MKKVQYTEKYIKNSDETLEKEKYVVPGMKYIRLIRITTKKDGVVLSKNLISKVFINKTKKAVKYFDRLGE